MKEKYNFWLNVISWCLATAVLIFMLSLPLIIGFSGLEMSDGAKVGLVTVDVSILTLYFSQILGDIRGNRKNKKK